MRKCVIAILGLVLSATGCAAVDDGSATATTAEGERVCTFLVPYCPPECHLSAGGCPQQCHCDDGAAQYTLCGDRHCGAGEVCCTGPVTTPTSTPYCVQGDVCPL